MDIKTGVIIAILFALLNKVAGFYGLITLLTGGSAAQITMYGYSVLAIMGFAWGLKAVTEEDSRRTLYFAHVFSADHLLNTIWTAFFAVSWWVYNPHDGERIANSDAQKAVAGQGPGNHNMTHDDRLHAAQQIWNEEKGLAGACLTIGWMCKIYFAIAIYSYANHLRKGTYRNLPATIHLPGSTPLHNGGGFSESEVESEGEGEEFYRMPMRTPVTTEPFNPAANPRSPGRRNGGKQIGLGLGVEANEVLWDEQGNAELGLEQSGKLAAEDNEPSRLSEGDVKTPLVGRHS